MPKRGMPPKLSKETRTPLHNRFGQWHVRLRSGGEVKAMGPRVNRSGARRAKKGAGNLACLRSKVEPHMSAQAPASRVDFAVDNH